MLQPCLIHSYHSSISVYTVSGRYIGEISKMAPIPHLKNILVIWQCTGHNGKSPFLAGHNLNPPLKSHIYT